MALNGWVRRLGVEQGRVEDPAGFAPTQGDFAFVLGSATESQYIRAKVGDFVEVEQVANLGGSALLRFNAKTRGPSMLPQSVRVSVAAAGLYRVTIPKAPGASDDVHFDYTAVGGDSKVTICAALVAAINAGSEPVLATITGVAETLQITSTDPEVPLVLQVTGSLVVGTFTWRAQLQVDGTVYFTQEIRVGRERTRNDCGGMLRNVSATGGDHTVALRLILDGSDSQAFFEGELPAFYVDNVTLDIFDPDPLSGIVTGLTHWWSAIDEEKLFADGATPANLTLWLNKLGGNDSIRVNLAEAGAPEVYRSGGSNDRAYVGFNALPVDDTKAYVDDSLSMKKSLDFCIAVIMSHFDTPVGLQTVLYKSELGVGTNYGIAIQIADNITAAYDSGLRTNGIWSAASSTTLASLGIVVFKAAGPTRYLLDGTETTVAGANTVDTAVAEPMIVGGFYDQTTGGFPNGAGDWNGTFGGRIYDILLISGEPTAFELERILGFKEAQYIP